MVKTCPKSQRKRSLSPTRSLISKPRSNILDRVARISLTSEPLDQRPPKIARNDTVETKRETRISSPRKVCQIFSNVKTAYKKTNNLKKDEARKASVDHQDVTVVRVKQPDIISLSSSWDTSDTEDVMEIIEDSDSDDCQVLGSYKPEKYTTTML